MQEELRDIGQKLPELLERSLDTLFDGGSDDWKVSEDEKLLQSTRTRFIETTKKYKTGCPIYRFMNTFDYQDLKVEIYETYTVFGLTAVQLKPYDERPGASNEGLLDLSFSNTGQPIKITILDLSAWELWQGVTTVTVGLIGLLTTLI